MANQVYANNREIVCKAADGKSICTFPDVCFTPPQTPATPPGVPVPYPNTGMASDCTQGSKTVLISGKEVMLKNESYFSKSTGDEAGCAPKKGVITSTNRGKVYFVTWSMDVKFEGKNVVRHLDLTTHNHSSYPGNTVVWPYVDAAAITSDHPCYDSVQTEQAACAGATAHPDGGTDCPDAPSAPPKNLNCKEARACALPKKKNDKTACCHPNLTGDHLVESNCFTQEGMRDGMSGPVGARRALPSPGSINLAAPWSAIRPLSGFPNYNDEEAPTACTDLPNTHGKHDAMQKTRDIIKRRYLGQRLSAKAGPLDRWGPGEESWWTYDEAASAGVASHKQEYPQCDEKCTRAQLDSYHHGILDGNSPRDKNSTPVRTYLPKKRK